jgi:hypothetical protein
LPELHNTRNFHYQSTHNLSDMTKAATKSSTRAPKSTSTSKTKVSSGEKIQKVCEEALEKLKALDLDVQLQRDLEWCLGSYQSDKNPVGLYDMAERALGLFQIEKAKKTKGITTKLITDLEKTLQERAVEN